MMSIPSRCALSALATNASTMRSISAVNSAVGAGSPALKEIGEGLRGSQPPSLGGTQAPPFQGRSVEALRPACANWMARGMEEYARTTFSVCPRAASVSSDQSPRSQGVIRPSGDTAVASMIRRPAPERARLPRCRTCQCVAMPSQAEYWHMGGITIRLERWTLPMA